MTHGIEGYPVVWYNSRSDQLAALNKFSKQPLATTFKPRILVDGMEVPAVKIRRGPLGVGVYGTRHSVLI